MKTRTKLQNFLVVLFLLICACSCESNVFTDTSANQNQLKQAQTLVEDDPQQALGLLDAINNPAGMGEDDYMTYTVTQLYAKYRLDQDISQESTIFEALNYFESKDNPKLLAQAGACAGWVNYLNGRPDKAIQSFNLAEQNAINANEKLIAARSLNGIGYIYFDEDIYDSAIVYYKKALDYCETKSSDRLRMKLLVSLGRSYEAIGDLKNAENYSNQSLEKAVQANNKDYQAKSLLNLGYVFYDKKDYKSAQQYFHKALAIAGDEQDITKLQFSLARVFNATNRLDSSNYYVNLVKAKIPNITYAYTLKSTYATLADYYKQTGDYKQALEYSNLEKATTEQIVAKSKTQQISQAEKQLAVEQANRESEAKQNEIYLNCGISILSFVVVFSLVFFLVYVFIRKQQKKFESNSSQQMEIDLMREVFRIDTVRYKETMLVFMDYDKDDRLSERKNQPLFIDQLGHKSNAEWTKWAYSYLSKQVFAKQLKDGLTDDEMLLLALCCNGYLMTEIAVITQVDEASVGQSIIELKGKMLANGFFTSDEIDCMFISKVYEN